MSVDKASAIRVARERPLNMMIRLLLVPFGERLRNRTELRQRVAILQTPFAKATNVAKAQ